MFRKEAILMLVSSLIAIGLLAALAGLRLFRASKDRIDTNLFKTVEIYHLDAFKYQEQELAYSKKVNLDENTTKSIFGGSTYRNREILWKGNFLGIVTLKNGEKLKIAISFYGGLFKILGKQGSYKMSEKGLTIYEETIRRILIEDFIPARKGMKPEREKGQSNEEAHRGLNRNMSHKISD